MRQYPSAFAGDRECEEDPSVMLTVGRVDKEGEQVCAEKTIINIFRS